MVIKGQSQGFWERPARIDPNHHLDNHIDSMSNQPKKEKKKKRKKLSLIPRFLRKIVTK